MSSGLFIVLEGPNRAGKSTLAGELCAALKGRPLNVVHTREPGGTPLGEGIRGALKSAKAAGGPFATALVFNGCRKEHTERVILPALANGSIVVCDRYYMSTDVYQGVLSGGMTPAELAIIESIHKSFPQPDLTVFILPSQEVLVKRGEGVEADRFEGNSLESNAYERYAATYSESHPAITLRPNLLREGHSKASEVLESEVIKGWLQRQIRPQSGTPTLIETHEAKRSG
jgi:dTMP kinase